jgi:hypothetical protein
VHIEREVGLGELSVRAIKVASVDRVVRVLDRAERCGS